MKTADIKAKVEETGCELIRDESAVSYTDVYGTPRLRTAYEWLIRKPGPDGFILSGRTPIQVFAKLRKRLARQASPPPP